MSTISLALSITLICLCITTGLTQNGQVLRIKSSNCAYNNNEKSKTNTSTGFVYKENGKVAGVVTALHAVCGCKTISAEDKFGKDYFSLTVIKADIGNDVALLTSNEILKNFSTGFEFSLLNPSDLANKEISMLAYPYGVESEIDTKKERVRETPTLLLKKFVKTDIERSLEERGSPNINNSVLNLQLEIPPGCSGAPILFDGKVIGVANGGLDEGRTHVCWAIPTKNIRFSPIAALEPTYSRLGKYFNPNKLFILTCDLENKTTKKFKISGNTTNIIAGAIGTGLTTYGIIKWHEGRQIYKTYRDIRNEDDPAYSIENREERYTRASKKIVGGQILVIVGGGTLIGLGTYSLLKKIKNKKNTSNDTHSRFGIEPFIPEYGIIGLGGRINF